MKTKIVLLVLAICLPTVAALAQTTTGRLNGVVAGPDGVLTNATIVAKDDNTNREITVTAKGDGTFLFPQLEFGTYTVTVTVPGFKTFVATEVKIDVGRDYTLNPLLEIGDIQESVTVTAGADVITTSTAQVSNTVSPQQIMSLPLLTRNPLDLTTLQAGVQSSTAQNTTINGMRTSFTNITRDGINIQDTYIRTNATDFAPGRPSVDDTAEFTISTSNQEADQGYGGAQIRLVTPRGTNQFSGGLFAYNRNSAFAANEFFNNKAGLERPFRNRNQYGGKIGGPLPLPAFGEGTPYFLRDKGFFFFAYEKISDPQSVRYTRTILTPGARTGEFRYTRATAGAPNQFCPSGSVGSVCTVPNILDYARGLTFAGFPNPNIPATIDPVIQARIISRLPTESNFTGGDGLNTAGYTLNRQFGQDRDTYTTRIDVDFNDRNTLHGVYSYNLEQFQRPDVYGTGYTTVPGVNQTSENNMLALAYRRVFTPTFINEFRGGFFFSDVIFDRYVDVPDFFLSIPLISSPEFSFVDQGRQTRNYNLQNNADWVVGKHSLKFGGQMQWFKPTPYNDAGTTPTFFVQTFSTTPQFSGANFPGGINATQLGAANNLLGLLGGFVVQGQRTFYVADPLTGFDPNVNSNQPFEYANYSLYLSDRWQATRNLTLTGGLRYDIFPSLRIANNLALEPVVPQGADPIQTILAGNGTYDVVGGNAGKEGAFYKTDYNNFAPQVGFAWAPKFENGFLKRLAGSDFVIRGGYSEAFSNDQIVTATYSAATGNVGLASQTGFARNTPTASTLLNLRLATDQLPPFLTPAFTPPPRTYLQNQAAENNFGVVFLIDPDLQTTKIKQYSLGIQRQLPGKTALEIRYVGTRSGNLIRAYDLNQVDIFNNGFFADYQRAAANYALTFAANPSTATPFCNPATVAGCQALQIFRNAAAPANPNQIGNQTGGAGVLVIEGAATTGLSAVTFVNNLTGGTPAELAFQFYSNPNNYNNHPNLTSPNNTPRLNFVPNPNIGVADIFNNSGWFQYNSLQIELRRRFAQGLYFQGNYTFSKNLTDTIGSLNAPLSGQSQFEPFLDINRPELNKQRADFDQTHVFNVNGIYQLPFGSGRRFMNRGGLADMIFGGWEVSGIVQWTSGIPITFVDPRGTFNRTARSNRQTASSNLTAEQIRALMGIFERNGNLHFINPDVINPNTGTAVGFDGAIFSQTPAGEIGNLGRTIVNGPGYFNVDAGLLKSIRFSERTRLQLRAEAFNLFNNVNWSLGASRQYESINSSTFGQITTATSPRIVQFGARFEF